MTIERNGVKYPLTVKEIYTAYSNAVIDQDKEHILYLVRNYETDKFESLYKDDALLERVARRYRSNLDDSDLRALEWTCFEDAYNYETKEAETSQLDNNFLLEVIEYFESFLECKGIRIPNEDRDAEDPGNNTNIYGMDFAEVMGNIREICERNGIDVADRWEKGESTNPQAAEKRNSKSERSV